jgi:hypothetical protein
MLGLTDDRLLEALCGMFGPALTGELGNYAVARMRHSIRQGVVGWRDDTLPRFGRGVSTLIRSLFRSQSGMALRMAI